RHQRRRRLGRRGVRSRNGHPLRGVHAHARHQGPRPLAAFRVEHDVGHARVSNMPWVPRAGPKMLGPQGLPDPFKPPYAKLTAIDLNKGEILWSVANGDGLRNHPAFKGLNLPPSGPPGRNAAMVTKTLVFMGEGSDSGVGVPAGFGGRMFRA